MNSFNKPFGPVSSNPRAFASATIAAAAACSGDSCRPSSSVFFRGLTTFDVITHSAHPVGPQPGVSGRKHRSWHSPPNEPSRHTDADRVSDGRGTAHATRRGDNDVRGRSGRLGPFRCEGEYSGRILGQISRLTMRFSFARAPSTCFGRGSMSRATQISLARIPAGCGAQDGEDLLVGGADHGRVVGGELGCGQGTQCGCGWSRGRPVRRRYRRVRW